MSEMTYSDYLRLPNLLSSQVPQTKVHDELQFIIVHQVFELWFRLLIGEIDETLSRLEAGRVGDATRLMGRMVRIVRTFPEYIEILETMRPQDFHRFRTALGTASGLQSEQFRMVEISSGLAEDPSYLEFARGHGLWTDTMEKRLEMPNLRQETRRLVEPSGASLDDVYARPEDHREVHAFLEACLEYDEAFLKYRFIHSVMAERMIGGGARGTGGMGAPYLLSTTRYRFFPSLWEVRDRITVSGGGELAKPGPEEKS